MAMQAGRRMKRGSGAALRLGAAIMLPVCYCGEAHADDLGLRLSILTRESGAPVIMDLSGPLGLIFIGLLILTATVAALHITGRHYWTRRIAEQDAEIGDMQTRLQRADIFMSGERHVVVAWASAKSEPDIEGDVSMLIGVGAPRRILGFSQWLPGGDVKRLEQSVERLKTSGEAFSFSADTSSGKHVEIDGRAVAGRAVMRVREVSGDRLERIKAEEKIGKLTGEMAALHAVLDALPHQLWLRYPDGRLAWVNKAYAEAVDCRHPNEAISKGIELIDRPVRERISMLNAEKPYRERIATIISGRRTMLDVADVRTPFGSGGIGVDAAETEALRIKLEAEMATHVRTLNELPIAVAIFDRKQQLRFSNAAYQKLWNLSTQFLNSHPGDSEILDRLRSDRRIPEQVDFRSWKQAMLAGYQKTDTTEHLWHLPDSRVLRVVANPTPDGGLSYLYHDMTERVTLEAQFKALSRVQSETLDSLKEGVAVFGSDGKLKLANAAFASIWRMHSEALQDNPHIDEIIRRSPAAGESESWSLLRGAITGVTDARRSLQHRDVRADNSVIDCATSPLPDGATLVTFADITANVNAERFLQEKNEALKDKNEALETAGRFKNDFIQNVSYELRAPLQNVTMATAMLANETVGPLTEKQKDYAETAMRSADALLSLMNDIFDLASLDAGAITLDLASVAPQQEIDAVATALKDQLTKSRITLACDVPADIGSFNGDPQRVRQVLFHLLANAIGFSSAGQSIAIKVRRDDAWITFAVKDSGRGIPAEVQSRIFERFETHTEGSSHRGVGLGLSMVKAFVELHHGKVTLTSKPGAGTTVTCSFPIDAEARASAAAGQKAA
jgi:signal transduction histidine kinase